MTYPSSAWTASKTEQRSNSFDRPSFGELRRKQERSLFLVQVEEDPAEFVAQLSRAPWVASVESATEHLHAPRVEASDLDASKGSCLDWSARAA
jgi:hypothetical protein